MTRWQLFLPQIRKKCPMPCRHPRSTFYWGMERPRRNQLGLNSCMKNLLSASIWPSLLAGRLSSTDDSILGQIFRMKVKISPPRQFPMHDGRANNICSYSQEHTFQIEHKRQCWNWKPRRRRARPFELSRRVLTMSQTLLDKAKFDKSSKIVRKSLSQRFLAK